MLRDEEGTVHVIPERRHHHAGQPSMDFSYYVINLPLAYGEDTDRVTALLTGDRRRHCRRGRRYRPFILEPLEVIGVDAFEERAVRLKVRIKTAPLKQWFVGREFRRRILQGAAASSGIEMWSRRSGRRCESVAGRRRTPSSFCPVDSWTILTPALAPTRVAPAATIAFSPS